VPAAVTSDRGTRFTSAVWECMCRTLGMKHILTSAFHPQSNGIVERMHRQLKEALCARECGSAWADHVLWVLLGLRSTPKELSGVSAAEAVFGSPLVLPNQLKGQQLSQSAQPELPLPPTAPSLPPTPLADPSAARERTYAQVGAEGLEKRLRQAEFVYVRKGNM
jgi:hypothetical protein